MSDVDLEPFKTVDEWRSWLQREIDASCSVYEAQPERLKQDRNIERSTSRGYHGREVLELLQNANDAAFPNQARVRIELSTNGLVVANTGKPFSPGGVKSLMLASLSTKKLDSLVIGNKGLGFRSVLNWTTRPIVFSGTLRLAFGPEFAATHWHRVSHVADAPVKGDTELPVLQFPTILTDGVNSDALPESWRQILDDCKRCSYEYDTVIGLPFDATGFEGATGQLTMLEPEVLLFVRNLSEVQIAIPHSCTTWRIERAENFVTLYNGNAPGKVWRIWERSGRIPEALIIPHSPSRYEVAMATGNDVSNGNKLYSYFSTQVAFPFNAICHASFDLDATRNHINQSELNEFITAEIASLHADVVESVAQEKGGWAGAQLAYTAVPMSLYNGLDYLPLLKAALREKRFLPAISGDLITPQASKYVSKGDRTWLPTAFSEVIDLENYDGPSSFFLDIPRFTEDEWHQRIDILDFSDVHLIGRFAGGLITSGVFSLLKVKPQVLTDTHLRRTREGRIYVSGSEAGGPELPDWLSFRFLHPTIRAIIQSEVGITDVRHLAAHLQKLGFDAEEYTTNTVTSAVVTQGEQHLAADPEKTDLVRRQIITCLFGLFATKNDSTAALSIAGLHLQNKAGHWTQARSCHFSSGYTDHGDTLELLYAQLPEFLVAAPDTFSYLDAAGKLTAFLRWLGVNDHPALCEVDVESDFVEYVRSGFPGTVNLVGGGSANTGDFCRGSARMQSVIGLSGIIKTASPEAILSWVQWDTRWASWANDSKDHGKLTYFYRSLKTYDGALPSYPRWVIQREQWLPGDDAKLHAPEAMMLADDGRTHGIIPRPAIPTALAETRAILPALLTIGVPADINTLSPEPYFKALRACESQPFKIAASYYRYLVENRKKAGDQQLLFSRERKAFIETGQIWCSFDGGDKLIPVKTARYRTGDDIPRGISKFVPVVAFPPKRGGDRIEALSGVRPLRGEGFSVHSYILRGDGPTIQSVVAESVESILLYRSSRDAVSRTEREALTKLQVYVCSKVEATFQMEGMEPLNVTVSPGEYVLTNKDTDLYIICPDVQKVSMRNEALVNAVAEAIASIFGVVDSNPYARLLGAESQPQRLALLSAQLGYPTDEIQEQLNEMLARADAEAKRGGLIFEPAPPSKPQTDETKDENLNNGGAESDAGTSDTDTVGKKTDDDLANGSPTLTEMPHQPKERRRQRLKVTSGHTAPGVSGTYTKVSGDTAEAVVLAYERMSNRHPVLVEHNRGKDGPGCDILSYGTAQEAEAVRTRVQTQPFENVERVIEVKGRKDSHARIILDGAELEAAQLRAENYYLYRVFQASENADLWEISILHNPARDTKALVPTMVIDLDNGEFTKRVAVNYAGHEAATEDAPVEIASEALQI